MSDSELPKVELASVRAAAADAQVRRDGRGCARARAATRARPGSGAGTGSSSGTGTESRAPGEARLAQNEGNTFILNTYLSLLVLKGIIIIISAERRPLLDIGLPQSSPRRSVLCCPHPATSRDLHQIGIGIFSKG
jgi:hypothetical protein